MMRQCWSQADLASRVLLPNRVDRACFRASETMTRKRGPIAVEYHGADEADCVVGGRGAGLVATAASAL